MNLMISYAQVTEWLEDKENKQKIILGICFVLVFIIGFGTGRLDQPVQKTPPSKQANYTTNPAAAQTGGKAGTGEGGMGAVDGLATTTSASCLIKGNINSKGYKIYHIPGGDVL